MYMVMAVFCFTTEMVQNPSDDMNNMKPYFHTSTKVPISGATAHPVYVVRYNSCLKIGVLIPTPTTTCRSWASSDLGVYPQCWTH